MQGRYKVYVGELEPDRYGWQRKRDKSPWSLVTSTCRSLAADGLEYCVQLFLTDAVPYVLIDAYGKAKPKKKRTTSNVRYMSAVLTDKQCQKAADESEKQVAQIRKRMLGNLTLRLYAREWRYLRHSDPVKSAGFGKLLGAWLACRLRRVASTAILPSDYKELEALLGWSVRRASKIPERNRPVGIKQYVLDELLHVRKHGKFDADDTPSPFPFAEYQTALLDVEYWREMERLSGQRDHYKPGLSSDNLYQDDEVAVA